MLNQPNNYNSIYNNSTSHVGSFLGRLVWQLNQGTTTIPFLSAPFEMGMFCLKECVQGKEYQNWKDKVQRKNDPQNNSNVSFVLMQSDTFNMSKDGFPFTGK